MSKGRTKKQPIGRIAAKVIEKERKMFVTERKKIKNRMKKNERKTMGIRNKLSLLGYFLQLQSVIFLLSLSVVAAAQIQPAFSSTSNQLATNLSANNRTPKKIVGRDNGRVSSRFLQRLERAQKLMAAEKYIDAIDVLKKLETSSLENDFALSQVYQTRAFVYAQSDNLKDATIDFKKVVELNTLPTGPLLDSVFALSQILASQELYDSALPYIEDYLISKDPPRPDAYYFHAQILSRLNRPNQAISALTKAMSLSENPKKSWTSFLVSLYFEVKNYKSAARYLHTLTKLEPLNKRYWKQLSSVYILLDDQEKALSALEAAHKLKLLTEENEILRLSRLAAYYGIPFKAAQYLAEGLESKSVKEDEKNMLFLSEIWFSAGETAKAIETLVQTIRDPDSWKIDMRLGQIYLQNESWEESIVSHQKALKAISEIIESQKSTKKTGEDKLGLIHLSIGIAYYNLGQIDKSRSSLKQAAAYPDYSAKANTWLKYSDPGPAI